jgi:hypothetical protein
LPHNNLLFRRDAPRLPGYLDQLLFVGLLLVYQGYLLAVLQRVESAAAGLQDAMLRWLGAAPRHPGTFLQSLLPALVGQLAAATTSAIALAGSRRILQFGACLLFIEVTYVCDGLDVKFESCD